MPFRVQDLPPPPAEKTGWPWTEETPPLPPILPGGKAWPRITVVTPSYQQGLYLEETLRSVLLQGYPNLEYIVMDGGSSDNSQALIKRYSAYLTTWVSERDNGQAHAINKGFARSTGEIMGWLNSDDLLLPLALRRIAETFTAHPAEMIVTGFRKQIDKHSRFMCNFIRDLPTNYYLRHYCCLAQETTYWRRALWEKLGPLDESFHFALDYEYWLRVISSGYSIRLMPYYTGLFRQYPENKTATRMNIYYRDLERLYQRYQLGSNEVEIQAQLGKLWGKRYEVLLALGFHWISNSPPFMIFLRQLLERRVVGWLAVFCYRLSLKIQKSAFKRQG